MQEFPFFTKIFTFHDNSTITAAIKTGSELSKIIAKLDMIIAMIRLPESLSKFTSKVWWLEVIAHLGHPTLKQKEN